MLLVLVLLRLLVVLVLLRLLLELEVLLLQLLGALLGDPLLLHEAGDVAAVCLQAHLQVALGLRKESGEGGMGAVRNRHRADERKG